MQKPLELTLRQIERSPALEAQIRREATRLETFSDEIVGEDDSRRRHRKLKAHSLSTANLQQEDQ